MRFWRDVLLVAAGILLAVGVVVLVWTATDRTLARGISGTAQAGEMLGYVVGGALAFAGAVCGCFALLYYQNDAELSSYNRFLVGTGYALALLALLNFTALVGFQACGQLGDVLNVDFSKPAGNDAMFRTVYLSLVPGFAVLGALFFHANSLRSKRDSLDEDAPELSVSKEQVVSGQVKPGDAAAPAPPGAAPGAKPAMGGADADKPGANPAPPVPDGPAVIGAAAVASKTVTVRKAARPDGSPPEPFSAPRFWAGLWFRIGEALLFALVVFLVVKSPSLKTWGGTTLLLVSLLLGMFVKSGESLIAGLAFRLFNAMQQMFKS